MDAKELRIGNLVVESTVNYNGINKKIISVKTKDLINISSLSPILLTEEWLLKLGFKKNGQKTFYYNDFKITLYDGEFFFYTFHFATKNQYVHQLQNLYFALTGEELTI